MSGWAQREAERQEDQANEMDELITENRELIAERDALRAELAAAKEERDRLAADNARLRKAMEPIAAKVDFAEVRRLLDEQWVCRLDACQASRATYGELENIHTALAATTAQSLAAHDAALLREVAVKWYRSGPSNAAVLLEDEADRIEQEAANG